MEMLRESRARDKVDGVDRKACIVDRNQFFNTQVSAHERAPPANFCTIEITDCPSHKRTGLELFVVLLVRVYSIAIASTVRPIAQCPGCARE